MRGGGEKFVGTKFENLSICYDEIHSDAVKIPLNDGFLLVKGVFRPNSEAVPNLIESLESF